MTAKKVDTATPETTDWSWVEDPLLLRGVEKTVAHNTRPVWADAPMDYDEGLAFAIDWISLRPEQYSEVTFDAEGVEQKVWNIAKMKNNLGYELKRRPAEDHPESAARIEDFQLFEAMGYGHMINDPLPGMQPAHLADGPYTRELVGSLIEAMYNEWTVHDEFRPDSDMPKARANPARQGTQMAHKIDIERAWEQTPLEQRSKLVLAAVYGYGWTQKELAKELGLSQARVSEIKDAALGLLVEHLNGGSQ